MTEQLPNQGRAVGVLNALKGLSFTNVLIIALMAMVAVPVYFVYVLLRDPATLDKFLSSYEEATEQDGCTLRTARLRGGPWRWSVATGFAYRGSNRWLVSVVLHKEPTADEIASYCASLNLIVDKMLGVNGGE